MKFWVTGAVTLPALFRRPFVTWLDEKKISLAAASKLACNDCQVFHRYMYTCCLLYLRCSQRYMFSALGTNSDVIILKRKIPCDG